MCGYMGVQPLQQPWGLLHPSCRYGNRRASTSSAQPSSWLAGKALGGSTLSCRSACRVCKLFNGKGFIGLLEWLSFGAVGCYIRTHTNG